MNRSIRKRFATLVLLVCAQALFAAQAVRLVKIASRQVARTTELPGEFYPFLSIQVHAKISGYVDNVFVDRGSFVEHGQLLVQLSAP